MQHFTNNMPMTIMLIIGYFAILIMVLHGVATHVINKHHKEIRNKVAQSIARNANDNLPR